MKNFLSKLIDLNTLKRIAWYAGSQAVVVFVAYATDMLQTLEPSTTTVVVGLVLSQITKVLNSK